MLNRSIREKNINLDVRFRPWHYPCCFAFANIQFTQADDAASERYIQVLDVLSTIIGDNKGDICWPAKNDQIQHYGNGCGYSKGCNRPKQQLGEWYLGHGRRLSIRTQASIRWGRSSWRCLRLVLSGELAGFVVAGAVAEGAGVGEALAGDGFAGHGGPCV